MNPNGNGNTNGNTTGDQTLTCVDCKQPFIFTAGEQKFFEERGFTPPKRCKPCRDVRKADKAMREGQAMPAPAQPSYNDWGGQDEGYRREGRDGRRARRR